MCTVKHAAESLRSESHPAGWFGADQLARSGLWVIFAIAKSATSSENQTMWTCRLEPDLCESVGAKSGITPAPPLFAHALCRTSHGHLVASSMLNITVRPRMRTRWGARVLALPSTCVCAKRSTCTKSEIAQLEGVSRAQQRLPQRPYPPRLRFASSSGLS